MSAGVENRAAAPADCEALRAFLVGAWHSEFAARAAGCTRVWSTTTNHNFDALRLYQRRGFRLVASRPGAIDEARTALKPELPEVGSHGIPMRDELDLEFPLG